MRHTCCFRAPCSIYQHALAYVGLANIVAQCAKLFRFSTLLSSQMLDLQSQSNARGCEDFLDSGFRQIDERGCQQWPIW